MRPDMTAEEYLESVLAGNVRDDCPMRRTLELLSGKWRTHIIYELCKRPSCRFGELKKALPRITNTMLTTTLRDLEGLGIVRRKQFNEIPPHVEYSLTEKGRALLPVFFELAKWGDAYLDEEQDLKKAENRMEKQFAIFDMDGTLVDSMGYWQRLGREFLTSRGVTERAEEILARTKTMTMRESGALFIQAFGISGTPESVAAEINGMMENHYRRDVPAKEGIREFLESQRQAGVRMCVASATAEELMETCLRRLGLRDYFEFLLSCETVGQGKNQPDIYLAAVERLGARPEETRVYEDAKYAVRTAKEAGFSVVGVYDRSSALDWEEIRQAADEVVLDWHRGPEPCGSAEK